MSEEQRKDEETEVEGHKYDGPQKYDANTEPGDEFDEVEGHKYDGPQKYDGPKIA